MVAHLSPFALTLTGHCKSNCISVKEQPYMFMETPHPPLTGDFDAQSLSRVVWALGRLRYVPARNWLRDVAGMSVSEELLRSYEPAHVVDLVEGLAAIGYKPREQITYAIMAVVSFTCDRIGVYCGSYCVGHAHTLQAVVCLELQTLYTTTTWVGFDSLSCSHCFSAIFQVSGIIVHVTPTLSAAVSNEGIA